jgi:hypothetical protein
MADEPDINHPDWMAAHLCAAYHHGQGLNMRSAWVFQSEQEKEGWRTAALTAELLIIRFKAGEIVAEGQRRWREMQLNIPRKP